jgi:hypothetical protein
MTLQFLLCRGGDKGWVELIQHNGYVTYPTQGGGVDRAPCMWFARCDRQAATTVSHPVCGDVPCCQPCSDFINRNS